MTGGQAPEHTDDDDDDRCPPAGRPWRTARAVLPASSVYKMGVPTACHHRHWGLQLRGLLPRGI